MTEPETVVVADRDTLREEIAIKLWRHDWHTVDSDDGWKHMHPDTQADYRVQADNVLPIVDGLLAHFDALNKAFLGVRTTVGNLRTLLDAAEKRLRTSEKLHDERDAIERKRMQEAVNSKQLQVAPTLGAETALRHLSEQLLEQRDRVRNLRGGSRAGGLEEAAGMARMLADELAASEVQAEAGDSAADETRHELKLTGPEYGSHHGTCSCGWWLIRRDPADIAVAWGEHWSADLPSGVQSEVDSEPRQCLDGGRCPDPTCTGSHFIAGVWQPPRPVSSVRDTAKDRARRTQEPNGSDWDTRAAEHAADVEDREAGQ